MAYGTKYVFTATSDNGNEIEILVKRRDYSGEVISRCLGGSPVLRMDESGAINGMSLEFRAECVVDDEFTELYTTDPRLFQVFLLINDTYVWKGFITPELYAAPWVDPPYDVQLTATDGLGELKRVTFENVGKTSLQTLIEGLLAKTGLDLPLSPVSSLVTDLSAGAADMLATTYVNLDHFAGKTCYDVLQSVLRSLHMAIRQVFGERWMLIRETDVTGQMSGGSVRDCFGNSHQVTPFGSSRSEEVWPVGRLEAEIVPARRGFVTLCPNEPIAELLADPDMMEGTWSGNASHVSGDTPSYEIAVGEAVSQTVTMPSMPDGGQCLDLSLTLSARQVDSAAKHNIRVKVSAYGKRVNATTYTTLYLTKGVDLSGAEVMSWSDTPVYMSLPLNEAAGLGPDDRQDVNVAIPFRSLNSHYIVAQTLAVEVASDDNTVYLHRAHLTAVNQFDGVETNVRIANDARGDADDVEACFADTMTYNMGLQFQANALTGTHGGSEDRVINLESLALSARKLGEFLSCDYALSAALPRLALRGKLYMPFGNTIPVFYSTQGIVFIVREWSYDLLASEMEVSLISLPAAAITVESVTTRKWVDESGASGGSSGGSGGSGVGAFLPLSGGTMTGVEKMVTGSLTRTTGAYLSFVHEADGSEVRDADVSANSRGLLGIYARNGIILRPGDGESITTTYGLVITKDDVQFNGVSILGGGTVGGNVFYGTCATASTASTKIVDCPGFTAGDLDEGTVLIVLFDYRNSSSGPYMNVNSTGNKKITGDQSLVTYRWAAGTVVTFVYHDQGWEIAGAVASPSVYGVTRLISSPASLYSFRSSYVGDGVSARMGWWLFVKSLRAPRLKILRGYSSDLKNRECLIADHPMSRSDIGLGGVFVLMMYSKRRRKRVSSKLTTPRKASVKEGWGEARGALASTAPVTWTKLSTVIGGIGLDTLRLAIVQRYVKTASGATVSTLNAFKVANDPGFGKPNTEGKRPDKKKSRLFGVAWRIENPAYVAPKVEVETTRVDASGNPRYIYSSVAPFRVWINEDDDHYNVMGFQLGPRGDDL